MRPEDEHNITSTRRGRTTRRFYYVCPRKFQRAACSNRHHRAEDLERRVRESVTNVFKDKGLIERRVVERIERERERDPRKEMAAWTEKLDEIVTKRRNYQDQQAAGAMTIPELKERLERLEEERETAQREIEALQSRQEHIEELYNEAAIVLALYATFAGVDLGLYPPVERRRLYEALGLKATAYADGRVEVELHPGNGVLPSAEKAQELVERIIAGRDSAYREQMARVDARLRKAGLEHAIPEERRGVMSEETSPM